MTCPNAIKIELSTISSNCFIEQISTTCLAQYSYYIEADKKAIVIDPIRDLKVYTDLLTNRSANMKYILETHFHADFVSGHTELANKTGAEIVFGEGAQAEFKFLEAKNNTYLELSDKIRILVLHTPGHTLESSCYVLEEKFKTEKTSEETIDSNSTSEWRRIAVFTGDTLFLGDVGRPDLAQNETKHITTKDLAGMLYSSIAVLKKELPNECVVFPGHGAGSACGKNIQTGTTSTMEIQKKTNYALNDNLNKDEFIEILTANIPTPPQYFFADVLLNKKEIKATEEIVKNAMNPIDVNDFEKYVIESKINSDIVILDAREHPKILAEGVIVGAVAISMEMSYAIYSATLFSLKSKICLIVTPGRETEAITRLTRVGFENFVGYLDGGFESWVKAQKPVKKLSLVKADDVKKIVEEIEGKFVLDIRTTNEHLQTGIVKNSQLIPLSSVEKRLSEISTSDPIYIMCKSGARAVTTGTILRRNGYDNELIVLQGGMDGVMKAGYVPTKYEI